MVGETRCAASCLGTLSVPQGGVGWSWICGIGLCGGLGAWGVATSLSGGLEATATWGRLAVAGASRLPQGGVGNGWRLETIASVVDGLEARMPALLE